LHGIAYASDIASAQVKSAVLLAGLYAKGETEVREPHPTRDYTERMLRAFGWPIEFSPGIARAWRRASPARHGRVGAGGFLVGGVLPGRRVRDSRVRHRAAPRGHESAAHGLLRVLRAMGAHVDIEAMGEQGGEAVADLHVRYAPLHGIDVPVDAVPDMIDEFPALFVAAACASGTTHVRGAAELRVKESDRIATMACGLRSLGLAVEETEDGAAIHGGPLRGGHVDSHGDHRVAMAFAIAGRCARRGAGVRHRERRDLVPRIRCARAQQRVRVARSLSLTGGIRSARPPNLRRPGRRAAPGGSATCAPRRARRGPDRATGCCFRR
jgi:3-phosphoshikimate 1-carboxyvinyltransferase